MKRVSWGYLGAGAAIGAVLAVGAGYVMQAANNAPAPAAKTSASNAATGAGLGAVAAGLLKAFTKKHSGATLLVGAVGGAALLATAFLVSSNPSTAVATTTPGTTPAA